MNGEWAQRYEASLDTPTKGDAVAADTETRAMKYIDLMLERVEVTKYPSKELLDRIERAIVLFWDEERMDEAQ